MVDPLEVVADLVSRAITTTFAPATPVEPMVRRSTRSDVQCDAAFALARAVGGNPADLARRLGAALPRDGILENVEVVTPPRGGAFINLALRTSWLEAAATRALADERLGVPRVAHADRVVLDYSSPNIAKEMHVGHLRSTVIGDALARVLEWRGHTVIRQNHLGDWGTPFGMLIEHFVDLGEEAAGRELVMGQLGDFYRAANAKFTADPAFADRARRRVVALQAGDAQTLAWWRSLVELSQRYFEQVYDALGVTLARDHIRSESFYNRELEPLVRELEEAGRVVESDGALCYFPEGFRRPDGEPLPLILRKRDGGYGYATTDLAAIRYRLQVLGARRVLYVVGAAQAQHLEMVFQAARELGWLGPGLEATHVAFGFVLGSDGKPLKSRVGAAFRLIDLIDGAIAAARDRMDERDREALEKGRPVRELAPEVREAVARAVGVGSIKHADLSSDRRKNYVYELGRMVAFHGDTAGYLQYAHARIRTIIRDLGAIAPGAVLGPISLVAPEERALVLHALSLASVLREVDATLEPHRLTGFLYDLATRFTDFYNTCPILEAEPAVRASRAAIAELTARTLARGLELLGIEPLDRM